ncbi:MAG: cell surface protein [Candidatus Syntrophoarchaeum caldarius]|uniref:Cell surface protein n=1 Tax=Candidatus Syntropharchaeum caldarium TaxID=1838285 RepID=A0A1F2PAG5_9EURY|nr:MAG: cell surface protein [Candidatus Syntrophoarchaeum caldarius]
MEIRNLFISYTKKIYEVWSVNHSIIVLGFLIILALCVGSAGATEIWVTDDYLTIQAAVNSASAYDTIIVRDGTYYENVDVNVDHLTIRSENGSGSTTVVGSMPALSAVSTADSNGYGFNGFSDHVFDITADYVNISGFTVTGATSGTWTSGIRVYGADSCTISENNVNGNRHGIRLSGSSNRNIIRDNTVSSNEKYGVYLTSDSTDENEIIQNTLASNEAGVYINNADSNNISCNYIFNNNYGIYLKAGSTDNTIKHNNIIANGKLQDDGSYHWQLYNNQKKDVSATNNWWGTTDNNEIDAGIYDDEEGKGKVTYLPKLEIPSTCAVTEPLTLVMVTLGILGVIGAVYRKREQ